MTKLSREQLIEELERRIAVTTQYPGVEEAQLDAAIFKIALASLEAEPVAINDDMAYAFHHALSDAALGADEVEEIKTGLRAAFANVAAPQPVAVPDERAAFNNWNNDTDCPLAGLTVKQATWLGWLKRSGTIKAFESATDEFEAWAKAEGLIHDSYGVRTVNTSADVARKAWNACRAAMLNAEPVSQPYTLPQWIPCSERMPEVKSTVLVYMNESQHSATDYAVADFDKYGFSRSKVTHWMPLPAAPQEPTK